MLSHRNRQLSQVVEKDAETDRKRAIIEAEKVAQVSKIQLEQQIAEKESLKKMSLIEDEMFSLREKSRADVEYYKALKVIWMTCNSFHSHTLIQNAEANKLLYTKEFLEMKRYEAISNNSKIYFGANIPQMFLDTSSLTKQNNNN